MMEDLIHLLHEGNQSMVVANGEVCTFDGVGVSGFVQSVHEKNEFLKGASIADQPMKKQYFTA